MNETTLGFNFGPQELIIILVIVLVIFGGSRLPQLAKALGQSKRAFKDGLDEADQESRIEAAKRQERLRASEEEKVAANKH